MHRHIQSFVIVPGNTELHTHSAAEGRYRYAYRYQEAGGAEHAAAERHRHRRHRHHLRVAQHAHVRHVHEHVQRGDEGHRYSNAEGDVTVGTTSCCLIKFYKSYT